MYTLYEIYFVSLIICMLKQQITLLTLTLVCSTWYKESTPWGYFHVVTDVDY